MAETNHDLKAENVRLQKECEQLRMELTQYKDLIDTTIDAIHDDEIKKEEFKSSDISMYMIENKMKQNDDKYILDSIYSGQLSVHFNENTGNKSLLILACEYGRFDIIKTCINLGANIDYETKKGETAFTAARSVKAGASNNEIREYLLLQKMSGGDAVEIINDCEKIQIENQILTSFLAEVNTDDNEFKQKLVNIITNMIVNKRPINSFLVNLSMTLNSTKTWQIINSFMTNTIKNTSDSLSWFYMTTYLLNNNSFLFKKYKLSQDETESKSDNFIEKEISDMSTDELTYLFSDIYIPQFKKFRDDIEINKNLIANGLKIERINGNVIAKWLSTDNKFLAIDDFLISTGLDMFQSEHFARFLVNEKFKKENLNKKYKVPILSKYEYGFDTIASESNEESQTQSKISLKQYFDNEEKSNNSNWNYLKTYGKGDSISNDARQDMLKFGVKTQYSRDAIIKKVTPSFNALKFYNLNIYLNKLMLRSAMLNNKFQSDVRRIFNNRKGVIYRAGPLKNIQRCKSKCETDYCDENWPQSACLKDIVRCTITVDNIDILIDNVKYFENFLQSESNKTCLKEILRIKNGFINYDNNAPEYTDVKYNIRINFENQELICEIQMLLKKMAKFKQKAHKYYNIIRRQEYFDNLKKVIPLKTNVDKQLIIFSTNGNHKGILNILIHKNINNYSACIKEFAQFDIAVTEIFKHGHIRCLKIFVKLCENDKDLKRLFLEELNTYDWRQGVQIITGFGHLQMLNYVFELLPLDALELSKQELLFKTIGSEAAEHGEIEIIEWCLSTLNTEQEQDKIYNAYGMKYFIAGRRGTADCLKYIKKTFQLSDEDIFNGCVKDRVVFTDFCYSKQMDVMEYLFEIAGETETIDMIKNYKSDKAQNMTIFESVVVFRKAYTEAYFLLEQLPTIEERIERIDSCIQLALQPDDEDYPVDKPDKHDVEQLKQWKQELQAQLQ
eukprot:240508_1